MTCACNYSKQTPSIMKFKKNHNSEEEENFSKRNFATEFFPVAPRKIL